MSTFVIPKGVREELAGDDTRCPATIEQKIRCELEPGHQPADTHRNGPLVWHEPLQVYVGNSIADTTTETEHWRDGRVRFSWDEPKL